MSTQLTLDVALEVGALSETVVVTSQAGSELQTANATIGNTINLKNLELLPNLGRDATSLLGLNPGVTPRGDIAGSYMDQNTFTIDGGNNTDDMAGNTIGYIQNFTGLAGSQTSSMASGVVATPIDTVEEFKVSTFGQTNDFNASSGALVQMVTKRGTDQWHGSGYGYYYATNHGAANSWVNNHTLFTKGVAPTGTPCRDDIGFRRQQLCHAIYAYHSQPSQPVWLYCRWSCDSVENTGREDLSVPRL